MRFLFGSWILISLGLASPAWTLEAYYGEKLHENSHRLTEINLAEALFEVLSYTHIQRENQPDELTTACPPATRCLRHKSIGYTKARETVFGQLFLTRVRGEYAVTDIYCNRLLTQKDFPKGNGPGPGLIPAVNVVNTEHAWPQSRFSNQFSKSFQKADLHILFATSSQTNNLRNNHPFGDVTAPLRQHCPASVLGFASRGSQHLFQAPEAVRGDLARANFYFSIRYKVRIDPEQEEALRAWHHADPVDEAERTRHEIIFGQTEVRNPFVDHPEWVDLIKDF